MDNGNIYLMTSITENTWHYIKQFTHPECFLLHYKPTIQTDSKPLLGEVGASNPAEWLEDSSRLQNFKTELYLNPAKQHLHDPWSDLLKQECACWWWPINQETSSLGTWLTGQEL